jgi:two-component system, OmpR family, phosphate regulon sensor histidine kinase PhoR
MKVLIVDDNADDRKLLRLNLERHGCETVIEASDGREGFDLARAHRPDLIISDALMPRLDGFQFLWMIKTDEELNAIPVVFYSAVYTGLKEEELAFSLCAEAFIVKPKEPEEFWQELTAILGGLETGKKRPLPPALLEEEKEYLRKYSGVVAAKLEEKVRELEEALARRKEAEDALRTQFTRISTIFDALNALVYVADMENGEILFMNQYGGSLFGDDWQGKTCYEVFQSRQGEHCGKCPNDMLVRDGIPQQPYVWEFRSSVNGRWYQGIDRAIPWTDGRLVRLQIAFDITERKELEQIKDGIISAVSHEMRTPLTALMGYTELMLTTELSVPQLKEYLKVIQQEADRLNELIGNFLDIQRQKAHRDTVGFRPVNIRPLMEETAALFGAASRNHRIIVDCPAELAPVLGDEKLLRRVLEMLVSNAVKFSPNGGEVCLGASMAAGSITIVVRDQGVGIPAEELEHVFELFYRVNNTDRRMFGGTGLGLALVREIALGHGGRVWAESSIGKGSAFYVSLPVHTERAGLG